MLFQYQIHFFYHIYVNAVQVSSSKASFNITSETSSVHAICSSFGLSIKFEVEVT